MNKLLVAVLASTSLAAFAGCVEPDDTSKSAQALQLPPDTACYGEGNFVGAKAAAYQEWTGNTPAGTADTVWIMVDLDSNTSALFQVEVDQGKVPFATKFPRAKRGQVITYVAGLHGQFGGTRVGPGGNPVGPRGDDPSFMGQWMLETGLRLRDAGTQAEQAVR